MLTRTDRGGRIAPATLLCSQDTEEAQAAWEHLEERYPAATTASWTWTRAWLDHYGDTVPHFFAVARQGSVPYGVALVTGHPKGRRGPLHVSALHLGAGTSPETGGLGVAPHSLLCAPARRMAFVLALLEALEGRGAWSELRVGWVDRDGAAELRAARPFLPVQRAWRQELDLTGEATLSPGVQARTQRDAALLGGDLAATFADPDDAQSAAEELVTNSSRAGLTSRTSLAAAFQSDAIGRLAQEGRALICSVSAGRRPVGNCVVLLEEGRAVAHLVDIAPLANPRADARLLLHATVAQACRGAGAGSYEFPSWRGGPDLAETVRRHQLAVLTLHHGRLRWTLAERSALTGTRQP